VVVVRKSDTKAIHRTEVAAEGVASRVICPHSNATFTPTLGTTHFLNATNRLFILQHRTTVV